MFSNRRAKILRARELRKEQTKAEERLWWLLRSRRMLCYKFRRQYIFRGFIIDFYCPSARLGLEIDGSIHLNQREYDHLRQNVIEENGVKLLRFTNDQVFNEPEAVLNRIIDNLPLSSLHFCPLLEEERGDRDEVAVGEVST